MTGREETRMRIGRRIAELRASKGMSQQQMADITGIQRCHISRIEQGRYSVGLDTLELIAEAVGYMVDFVEVKKDPEVKS